jgi:hypothetical protein
MKLEILIKQKTEFGKRNDIAIHLLEPTYNEILDAIHRAETDMFPRVVIYVDSERVVKMHNIFASNSTWNRLRRDFGDVRYGMIQRPFGQVDGDGFTIYMENN